MSARKKIIALGLSWVALCAVMFGYVFGLFSDGNAEAQRRYQEREMELYRLQAEQESFQRAERDLEVLERDTHQPEQYFSRDVTLVSEIETLEKLASSLKLTFALSGLSGTASAARRAKAQSDLLSVPYSVSIGGAYADVVEFFERLEHLPFITHVTAVTVSAASGGKVNASFTGVFFVRK